MTSFQSSFFNPMTAPRYTQIPSFMRAPIATDLTDLDIGLVGVPYDGGTTNRPGARHGPREIRNQSSLTRSIHHVTRVNPYQLCSVADVGDVPFTHLFEIERVMEDIEAFYSQLHQAGVAPVSAGGDHSITLPIFRAIAKDEPIGWCI